MIDEGGGLTSIFSKKYRFFPDYCSIWWSIKLMFIYRERWLIRAINNSNKWKGSTCESQSHMDLNCWIPLARSC